MNRQCQRRMSFTLVSPPQKKILITVNTPKEWKVRGNKNVFVVPEAECDISWLSFFKEKSRRVLYSKLRGKQDNDQNHRIFVTHTKRFFNVHSSIATTLNLHNSTGPGHFSVKISKATKAAVRTNLPQPPQHPTFTISSVMTNTEPVASTSKIEANNSVASALTDAATKQVAVALADSLNLNIDAAPAPATVRAPSSSPSETSDYRVIKVGVSSSMNGEVGLPHPQPRMNQLRPENFELFKENFGNYMNDCMMRLVKMELEGVCRGDDWTLLASMCPHTWALLQYTFQLNFGLGSP